MNYLSDPIINIKRPVIIGYMSTDHRREYLGNLSQLKFLNSVPENVNLDLNHGIHRAVKRTTDDNNEKINLLLKFLCEHSQDIEINDCVISYRRTLISIMCSAYHNEHVRIVGSLFHGSIYLCSLETLEEKQKRHGRNRIEDKFCAWGYKFEQYLLSDLPSIPPNIEKPVVENEEFSLILNSAVGRHNLVYGAQIDGLLAIDTTTHNPPSGNDFQENLRYLKNSSFVELKTNRELQSFRQEQNLRKYKMLRCWCQCYLANLKGLLVGFRDDTGVVKRLQCFNTEDIVEYCKNIWQPELTVQVLNSFLDKLTSQLRNHPNANQSDNEPVSLVFDVRGTRVEVSELSECPGDQDDFIILPDWYIKTKLHKNT